MIIGWHLILDILQFALSVVAGAYALYQYRQSRIDKRHERVHSLLMKLHDDPEFRKFLYDVDKGISLREIRWQGQKEVATDRMLHFINYLGYMLDEGQIYKRDLMLYSYELNLILNCKEVKDYIKWLQKIDVPLVYISKIQRMLIGLKNHNN